jgi:hypothetical protein
MKKTLLILLFLLLSSLFLLSVVAEDKGNIPPLPSTGSKFVYFVQISGDFEAIKERPGEHYEIFEFEGIVPVKGRTKEGIVETSPAYNCAWFGVSRNDSSDRTDLYLSINNSSLGWYLEHNSNGDVTWYLTPSKFIEFPVEKRQEHSTGTRSYIWVHNTGSWIVSTYETSGRYPYYKDYATIDVCVSKQNLEVRAGIFECYRIDSTFKVDTGSGLTASSTTNKQTNWYSPKLKMWVKERSELSVSAALGRNFSATRTRELIDYSIEEK